MCMFTVTITTMTYILHSVTISVGTHGVTTMYQITRISSKYLNISNSKPIYECEIIKRLSSSQKNALLCVVVITLRK